MKELKNIIINNNYDTGCSTIYEQWFYVQT